MSIRKKNSREYVKYEDGKLISIIETPKPEPKVPLPVRIRTLLNKRTMEQFKPKEIKNKVMKNFSFKSLFLIFIASSLLFIYVYYFTDIVSTKVDEPNIPNNSTGNIIDVGKDEDKSDFEIKPNDENKPNDNIDTTKKELTDLQQILKVSNELSTDIQSLNLSENGSIIEYLFNKQNRITTMKYLNRMTIEKEDLYIKLITNKPYFSNDDKLYIYEILEQRILLSLKKTDKISELLEKVSSVKEIEPVLDSFNENDVLLRNTYEDKLIEILNLNNVSYEKVGNKIIFDIEAIN